MQIIFEGADLVGKSTLAKLISEELNLPLRGRIVRKSPSEVVMAHLDDISNSETRVLDRCYYVSDTVYEPIFSGNKSACTRYDQILDLATDFNSIMIWVTAREEVLRQRFEDRGDELYGVDDIIRADKGYQEFFDNCFIDHLKIDTSEPDSLEENIEKIKAHISALIGGC